MLELGGKSGLVVFDDVDVDDAVRATMTGFLTNAGQICTAHTRLIVHEDLKDALLAGLKVTQLRRHPAPLSHSLTLLLSLSTPPPPLSLSLPLPSSPSLSFSFLTPSLYVILCSAPLCL